MKIILSGVTDETKWHCPTSSQVPSPTGSSGFFFSLMIPAALATLRLWVRLSLLTEISSRDVSWRERRPVPRAENLPLSCADCQILGVSTSWSPKSLSRPVTGWLYLYWIKLNNRVHGLEIFIKLATKILGFSESRRFSTLVKTASNTIVSRVR